MHAHALEVLEPYLKDGSHVLDVGSGSGYLTACMAHMVGPSGKVVGIDHIPDLVELSKSNLLAVHSELTETGRLELIGKLETPAGRIYESGVKLTHCVQVGDGRQGYPKHAPYNAIHVGAAAHPVPKQLLAQLKSPGRMVIPVGTYDQNLCQYDKDQDGTISVKELMGVRYVPLTDREAQVGV
ncbi:Protein-L-isoaspartate(D-aspartate) O-methyltransferase [Rhizophlyctis rosea]|uniref:protein-L-isoaspartate(D-aspartate) O-methyltransferase n=1 Tax=Rhizophlyctis rosea TaxID=64517 RepID=A0AAD5SGH1_9FUNG|nr:Protein-L-isoaspartate(D-aspartate) O-methyltransferase [Rhizophlyctis rosea]